MTEKKGTTCVGIVARDAVIVATDRQVTGVKKQESSKLFQIHPNGVLAVAGSLSDSQHIVNQASRDVESYRFKRGRTMTVDNLTSKLQTALREPVLTAPLFAGYEEDVQLIEYGVAGSELNTTEFTATGSGTKVALGTIEEQYHDEMSRDEATELATNAIEAANEHGVYTGVGVDVAIVDEGGVTIKEEYKSF